MSQIGLLLDRDREVVVLCMRGIRSWAVRLLADRNGRDSIRSWNRAGGIDAWKAWRWSLGFGPLTETRHQPALPTCRLATREAYDPKRLTPKPKRLFRIKAKQEAGFIQGKSAG